MSSLQKLLELFKKTCFNFEAFIVGAIAIFYMKNLHFIFLNLHKKDFDF